jgi:hypothetical protein
MKRILLSFAASTLIIGGAVAQNQGSWVKSDISPNKLAPASEEIPVAKTPKIKKSSAITIWSEDFANGIPSTWTVQGFDVNPTTGNFTPNPLCNWEYRGPGTTPDNTVGSRGAFAAGTPTIASPTASNGFIIFDSDFRDNGGTPGGTGTSAAPHYGTLTSDTIDLTGYPFVELKMYSHLRQYSSRFLVALSSDGGLTYSDTVEFGTNVAVNDLSGNPDLYTANISAVGGSSQVVLQFIFDGTPEVNTAAGPAWAYYYWMLDDIEIVDLPANAVRFTDWQDAPYRDVIYPANGPKYGNPQLEQAALLPVVFDANIYNYGSAPQYNLRLNVDILDNTGSVTTSLQSPTLAVLNPLDTGTFNDFTTTGGWTPSAVGDYQAVLYFTSDSANMETEYDTVDISVNDVVHAGHFNSLDRVFGLSQGPIALAQLFTFPASVDTNGYVAIEEISMYVSAASDTNGSLLVEVYDSAGFTYGTGGGPAGQPVTVKQLQLNAGNIGQTTGIDMTTNGNPLFLPSNSGYWVVVNLISPTGDQVAIGCDKTLEQPGGTIAHLSANGGWFYGYSNGLFYDNLIINMRAQRNIGINEEAVMKQNSISMFPNPTSNGMVNFELGIGGSYEIEVTNITGQRVYAETISVNGGEVLERNFSDLQKGTYLVNFTSEEIQMSKKLIIE